MLLAIVVLLAAGCTSALQVSVWSPRPDTAAVRARLPRLQKGMTQDQVLRILGLQDCPMPPARVSRLRVSYVYELSDDHVLALEFRLPYFASDTGGLLAASILTPESLGDK